MDLTAPTRFPSFFLEHSPFRKPLEGWVFAVMATAAALFVAANAVFLVNLTAPPLGLQVVLVLLSLAVGGVATVLGAVAIWIVVAPVRWALWRCAWELRSAVLRRGAVSR